MPLAPPTRETVTFRRLLAKVAVTALAADHATVDTLPFVEVQPVRRLKAELRSALLACRCTTVPCGNFCAQVVPQSISAPGSVPTTVPVPAPFLATLSVTLLKFAVTVRGAMVVVVMMVQVDRLTDEQPLQLVKLESESGAAVKITVVFGAMLLTHVVPQLMFVLVPPGGLATLVMVPVPVPIFVTVSRLVVKVAVGKRSEVIVTLHTVPLTK